MSRVSEQNPVLYSTGCKGDVKVFKFLEVPTSPRVKSYQVV